MACGRLVAFVAVALTISGVGRLLRCSALELAGFAVAVSLSVRVVDDAGLPTGEIIRMIIGDLMRPKP
jgi:hypothetical protein